MSMTITKRIAMLLLITPAAMALWVSPGIADTVPVTDDSFIDLARSNTNKGANGLVRIDAAGRGRQGFVRFDLSALPRALTGADIERATLRLFPDQVTDEGTLLIHVVEETWDEATLTAGNAPVYDPAVVSDAAIAETDQNAYVSADITDVVRDWVDGLVTNNGIALTSGDGLNALFVSKENRTLNDPLEIEVDLAGPAGGDEATSKTVFLTSRAIAEDSEVSVDDPLGPPSVAAAHNICNVLARAAGLPGTYRAWVGDANHDPDRNFIKSSVPYVLPNGLQVADDYTDLVDCTNPTCLDAPINVTERGIGAGVLDVVVWANVGPNGVVINADPDAACDEATASGADSVSGDLGRSNHTNRMWTGPATSESCNNAAHFYCFEQ